MVDASVDYSEIFIDTSDPSNRGTRNHCAFTISNVTNDVIGLNIIESEIPYSWNVINSSNYTLVVDEANGRRLTAKVTPGNYSANNLAVAIAAILTAASNSSTGAQTDIATFSNGVQVGTYSTNATAATASLTYVVAFHSPTQHMYIYQNNGATNFTVKNSLSTLNVPIGWGTADSSAIVGFAGSGTAAPTAANQVFVGGATVNLGGSNYLYLRSNLGLAMHNNIKGTLGGTDGGGNTNIIAKIPISVDAGAVIYYMNPNTTYYFSLNGVTINELEFYLTLGTSGAELDLNGQPFSLKIALLRKSLTVGINAMDQDSRVFKRSFFQAK